MLPVNLNRLTCFSLLAFLLMWAGLASADYLRQEYNDMDTGSASVSAEVGTGKEKMSFLGAKNVIDIESGCCHIILPESCMKIYEKLIYC